jgi:hypothetical protein
LDFRYSDNRPLRWHTDAGSFDVWPDTNVPVGRMEVWLTDHRPEDGPAGPYIVVGGETG